MPCRARSSLRFSIATITARPLAYFPKDYAPPYPFHLKLGPDKMFNNFNGFPDFLSKLIYSIIVRRVVNDAFNFAPFFLRHFLSSGPFFRAPFLPKK